MKLHFQIIAAAAVLASCSPFAEDAGGGSAEVTVRIAPEGFARSRSSFSWDEDLIRDIQVVVTSEDGTVHDILYSDTASDLQFTGTPGSLYRLWAAANLGGKVEVGCLEDFTQGIRSVSRAGIAASGIPMYSDGCCEIRVGEGENLAVIPLRRMMARIDFSIDKRLLDYPGSFRVNSVRICSPVSSFTPFTEAIGREHEGQPGYDFDSASEDDISRLNSGGTVRLYAFENMQGTLLPGNTDPWKKVPSSIDGAGPYCTYIEVVCDYGTDTETGSGITYRMYLGEDATTNFDVRRNTVYRLTLEPTEEEIHGDRGSWKVEAGEWEDIVEAELVLSPSYLELEVGESATVSSHFILTWPDGRTEEDDSWCRWSVVGMGYRYVDIQGSQTYTRSIEVQGKAQGSATISAKATYYDCTYTAGMTVEVVDRTPNPVYSSEYEYELAVSPGSATLAEGETTGFEAVYITKEYTLADGVRVSDEPSSVTETDVTEIAYWSVRSGAQFVTSRSGGVFAWASGPGSAVVEATFNGRSDTAAINTLAHNVVYTSDYEYELVISPQSATLAEGETTEFKAVYITKEYTLADGVRVSDKPSSVTEADVTEIAYWSVKSGAQFVANRGGGVFEWASGPGSAVVETTFNGRSDTAAINTLAHNVAYTNEYEYELAVSPGSATLAEGETTEFEAVYITKEYTLADGVRVSDEPSAVTETDVTEIAYWSVRSGAQFVASRSGGVFAWASGPGSAVVEATFNGRSDTAAINTLAHNVVYTSDYEYELVISPQSATLAEGETTVFEAVYITKEYTLADGVRVSDEPSSVTETNVTEIAYWSVKSGAQFVANRGDGVFEWASGPGSAVVEATFNGRSDTAAINTLAHNVVYTSDYEYELVISPQSATLAEGETTVFEAVYITKEYTLADGVRVSDKPSSVTEADVTEIAYWSVKSGAQFVTSRGGGVFAWASGPGSAVVEATFNGRSDTAAITTMDQEPVLSYRYYISPENSSITVGTTQSYVVTRYTDTYKNGILFQTGTVAETLDNASLGWSSSDTRAATVSKGVATGLDYGDVTITATVDATHSVSASLGVRHTFVIIGTSPSSVKAGESVTVSYRTTLDPEDIDFYCAALPSLVTGRATAASCTLTFPDHTPAGTYRIVGGNSGKMATDETGITVTEPEPEPEPDPDPEPEPEVTYELIVEPWDDSDGMAELDDSGYGTYRMMASLIEYHDGEQYSDTEVTDRCIWTASSNTLSVNKGMVYNNHVAGNSGHFTIYASYDYGSGTCSGNYDITFTKREYITVYLSQDPVSPEISGYAWCYVPAKADITVEGRFVCSGEYSDIMTFVIRSGQKKSDSRPYPNWPGGRPDTWEINSATWPDGTDELYDDTTATYWILEYP